jgi:hypothetical protein
VARRKVNTYGKGPRKIRVHDLYDVGAHSSPRSTAEVKDDVHLPSQSAQGMRQPAVDEGSTIEVLRSCKAPEAKSTPTATSSTALTATDMSATFDIDSSEADSRLKKPQRALKKRKLISTTSQEAPIGREVTNEPRLKMSANKSQHSETSSRDDRTSVLQYKPVNASARDTNSKLAPSSTGLKRRVVPEKSVAKRAISTKSMADDANTLSISQKPRLLRASSGSSAEMSESSTHSHASTTSTPKRKRGATNSGMASPTLSDLHLTSLRLTPGSGSQRSPVSSDNESMVNVHIPAPRRGKPRLIDRLDAPRMISAAVPEKSTTLTSQQSHSQPPNDTAAHDGSSQLLNERQTSETQPSNVGVVSSGRPRATYAKQRSHLSDMVDTLDSLPSSSSQPSSQQKYSQTFSFTNAASQVEMEMELDDSDDADASTQVKSIHELRRGGAVRQFDLDAQSILEDVESSSKSLRIPGLLQLAKRLKDQTFLRHFQDSGNFQRLIDCLHRSLDDISATILASILRCLVHAQTSSPGPLLQMLEGIFRLPRRLFSESRRLSKLAKDRSQNLSRILVKDVVEFEEMEAQGESWLSPSVNNTILGLIESAERKLISLKEPLPTVPSAVLERLLADFVNTKDDLPAGRLTSKLENTRLLLSLLEIACAKRELSPSILPASQLFDLGRTVAEIMKEASQAQPEIEASCLRLIVSLSNNDADVCAALSQSGLTAEVFQVIDDHFLTLAGLTALDKDFDHAQLESVILAVGCLLNLAECSDAARVQMASRDSQGRSLVDRLVDIFNSYVDQASEVNLPFRSMTPNR